MKSLSTLLLLLSFQTAIASDALDVEFERLRDSGESFVVTGSICEHVAREKLRATYPDSQYDIRVGISYASDGRTLGELDVVVFKDSSEEAVLIAEVKCWRNLDSAQKKARSQRARFQKWIESDASLKFFPASHNDDVYAQRQFETRPEFISISQEGGEKSGFDISLDYSLDELMSLRRRLIDCQEAGECRRPPSRSDIRK